MEEERQLVVYVARNKSNIDIEFPIDLCQAVRNKSPISLK